MVTTLCYYFVYYEVQVFVYSVETPYIRPLDISSMQFNSEGITDTITEYIRTKVALS